MNKRIKKLAAPTEEETRIADLEAENARLQERVTETEHTSDGLHAAVLMGSKHTKALEAERDGYKTLAEQRGEALEKVVSRWQSYRSETLPGRTRNQDLGYCAEDMKEIARDAIAISPEQAREKEGK